ncbi:unnamed protein product [Dibothriocephalus latus]|uniref:Endonuclease/exonuclease/phosphatase domain-containing protein n=1 Tax=Dibothriocephalus latus TaxID=60516 RepID=A0A3P7LKM6_DIBLA|nr:unnamed protein product [Dibothriocephalus latus]
MYGPPRSDSEAGAGLLEELARLPARPDVLVVEDFNAPLVEWNSTNARGPEQAFNRRLLALTLSSCLIQHVLYPTRNDYTEHGPSSPPEGK